MADKFDVVAKAVDTVNAENAERQTITAKDVGTLDVADLQPTAPAHPNDLKPNEVEYVRNKIANMDLATVQDFRDKETKLPFIEGGRPAALKVFDERIAELSAQPKQEG
jgi:hypothetical protein